MVDLAASYGSKVSVALICEDDPVRKRTLDTCSDSRRSAVRSRLHINVEIFVCEYRTSYRGKTDGLVLQSQLFDAFGNESVDDAVCASRTVVERFICKSRCLGEQFLHLISPPFPLLRARSRSPRSPSAYETSCPACSVFRWA